MAKAPLGYKTSRNAEGGDVKEILIISYLCPCSQNSAMLQHLKHHTSKAVFLSADGLNFDTLFFLQTDENLLELENCTTAKPLRTRNPDGLTLVQVNAQDT